MFSASTTGATPGGRLPNKIDSLIERYALYAGGVLVSHGYNQYNVLRHAKDVATYQLQINSSSIPQFKANEVEMYTISKNSVDNYDTEHCMTLDQYHNYFVQCVRFCMPDSDFGRMISGLDTRSVSAACSLVTEGLANTTRLDVFCECHSSLRIGPGKAIEVVV